MGTSSSYIYDLCFPCAGGPVWVVRVIIFFHHLFFFKTFAACRGGLLYSDCPNRWKTPEFPFFLSLHTANNNLEQKRAEKNRVKLDLLFTSYFGFILVLFSLSYFLFLFFFFEFFEEVERTGWHCEIRTRVRSWTDGRRRTLTSRWSFAWPCPYILTYQHVAYIIKRRGVMYTSLVTRPHSTPFDIRTRVDSQLCVAITSPLPSYISLRIDRSVYV